ncbi:MAG: lactonase family protein [Lachnospiraceae bacterium]|nr:lactonase family protein [Lachnospiraceae bacterium]
MSDKASKNAKYVVYGAGYTVKHGDGITIYDYDPATGHIKEKSKVKISNPSYITISHNRKFLYSITDEGVIAYKILPDGNLEYLNISPINGMRGCYISTDYEDKFVFVAGYHDGKVTVLSLKEDGSVNKICDEIYHKGFGGVGERNFRPHVDCAKMTRDNKYLCATDVGMDHVKVYRLNHDSGHLDLADVVRSDIESAPHQIKFSHDGKYAYIIHELKNIIDVYTYEDIDNSPVFTKIQTITTVPKDHSLGTAAYALQITQDDKYVFGSNAGDDSVACYKRDVETGKLEMLFVLPVSGQFPKDIAISDDNKFLLSINNESNTISFFDIHLDDKTLIMNGPMVNFQAGNCIIIHKLLDS